MIVNHSQSSEDVAKFFDPSVDAIKAAVDEMKLSAKVRISVCQCYSLHFSILSL